MVVVNGNGHAFDDTSNANLFNIEDTYIMTKDQADLKVSTGAERVERTSGPIRNAENEELKAEQEESAEPLPPNGGQRSTTADDK